MSNDAVAVIQTGGKQYLVRAGETLRVELLDGKATDTITFEDLLHGATVTATVVEHGKGDKVWGKIFQSKSRHSRYPHGHRQGYTLITIESIGSATKASK